MISSVDKSVLDRLQTSPYLALREIRCEYRDGIVMLRGTLPTHYLKQVAQDLAAGVDGVKGIVNHIEVRSA
jgi:osmotically-inducible protein OsmY